jgi:hypothetical protein
MKVVHTYPPHKEQLPVKYTWNIKCNFASLGLNQQVGLRRKNPLQKEEGFNKKMK